MTEEETLAAAPFLAYGGAKTLAEKVVWKFADEHKHLDITVGTSFHLPPIVLHSHQSISLFSEPVYHLWPLRP
jgi:hypothetical protein